MPHISQLPQDILSHILKNLLPPLPNSPSIRVVKAKPYLGMKLTSSFLTARLISRTMASASCKWFWRILDLKLPMVNVASLHIFKHLHLTPSTIEHTRFLFLRIWAPPNDEDIQFLISLMRRATSLDYLKITFPSEDRNMMGSEDVEKMNKCSMILKRYVTTCPGLDTLVVHGLPKWTFEQPGRTINNLRNIHSSLSTDLIHLLVLCPNIKSLSLVQGQLYSDDRHHLRCRPGLFPWTSINELRFGFLRVEDLHAILDNYLIWKANFFPTTLALRELIVMCDLDLDDVNRLLIVFNNETLRFLSLNGLAGVTSRLLSRISNSFSGLQRLYLYTRDHWGPWLENMSAILPHLRNLRHLTHLSWMYLPLPVPPDPLPEIIVPATITESYLLFTPILAGTCPRLQYVHVLYEEEGFTFKVLRDLGPQPDRVGDFECVWLGEQGEEQEEEEERWEMRTSFWTTENERVLLL
ncbi:hypothetical protein M422DRAFT_35200 [Sphaerobolus stellatus SS14]|uniref:Uncharacterized protein n=1 Tax=Sphaerobolus stellatus (strain SS14) TaxID=990650 RepID=A0A0C9UH15_SPHS4|nr:hypothetical protein M422DRAFT_35200 [Sphaerobolus stellatus SS14]